MNLIFENRRQAIEQAHQELISRKNTPLLPGNGIYERYTYPVLTADHTPLHWRYDFDEERIPFLMERFGI
ncbi:MAG TPA: glycosidase, partial [Sphingobacterium sp.]|nr:glycosidase [Sphingobacterium sp.]